MKIGIIGSGKIGGTSARLFLGAGHEVALSNARGPATLAPLIDELGPRTRAVSVAEASVFGEVVLAAIPFRDYRTLPMQHLGGKVLVDAMNYYPQRDGPVESGDLTSSELVARHVPKARLVKAFNTMYFETLATQGRRQSTADERLALFLAGDDADAKAVISDLIAQIGFAPIDTGSLHDGGRLQQPGSPIYNRPMTGREARRVVAAFR